jgi:NAD(P)-dependent dehydrogenase (short-subunit alcohol dehydrogenase family)
VVYPTGSIQDLGSDVWTDALSTKVLSSINVTRVFLPLLSHNQSRILILTPSIINTLNPSQNGVESVSVSALEAFTRTLRRETKAHNVSVSHIRMGSFDFGSALSKSSTLAHSLTENGANQGIKVTNGSHPRELHYAVFDALTMSRPFISRRVGRGSLSYDIMGSVMSASIIDWMLNVNHSTGHDLSRSVEGWEKVESHN